MGMKPGEFKRWRKAQGWSQKDAADALGLKRRVVQYYEKGERGGEAVKIPRVVRLACYALAQDRGLLRSAARDRAEKEAEKVEEEILNGVHAASGSVSSALSPPHASERPSAMSPP